jgi:putative aldouronate transport system substrate-binding protein
MKRVLGLALAILVVSTALVFAGGEGESGSTQEPLTIRWFGTRSYPGEGTEIPGMIEELVSQKVGYPVTFELMGGVGDGEMHATQDMLLAANDLPDVFQRFSSTQYDWLRQAATKFSTQEYKENMPMQAKWLAELMVQVGAEEDSTWAKYQDPEDGMFLGAPRIWEWGWVPSGQLWRKDILDELGYEIPTTLAEAEEVFEAYKATYPDKYALTGRGKTNWQCFDLVFNAFGLPGGNQVVRDGRVVQDFATREYREALIVLNRWYTKGYWDPNFINHALEWMTNFAEGNYIVTQWTKDWHFMDGDPPTRWLEPLRDIPGAMAVPATHLAADENTKPAQQVWNPFLTQLTVFGIQLADDRDKLHRIMNVVDLFAADREVQLLAQSGIEGVHYEIPEGEMAPKAINEVVGMSTAEVTDKFGFGAYWSMPVSSVSWLLNATREMYEKYVMDDDAIYGKNNLTWHMHIVQGPVTDESGEPVQVSTKTPWFDMVVDIMTGKEPIEYYDEWLEFYYDSGGKEWEEHATRLWGHNYPGGDRWP